LWHTDTPPYAPWLIAALPDDKTQSNLFEIGVPYVLTPLVTHSINVPIPGLVDLENAAIPKIISGMKAITALQQYSATHSPAALATFQKYKDNMGYGFLAQRYAPNQDLSAITPAELPAVLQQTARDTIPNVFVTFWAFRIMMVLGFYFVVIFSFAAYFSLKNQLEKTPFLLKLCMWSIPLPFLATEFGWITAEAGRQPWTVYGWLPTFQSASSHSVGYMVFSLIGFALLYSLFIAAELYLMFKYARLGPEQHSAADHPVHVGPAPIPIFGKPGFTNKSSE
jgi:cytochrome bd ubiquinol oxidase subunit I